MEITYNNLPEAVTQLRFEISEIKRILLEKSNSNQPNPDQLLTIQQAAEFLNLSVPTLYGYVHRSSIPVCKRPGTKRLYFSREELQQWVKAGRKKTISEIESEAENYLANRKNKS